MNKIFKNFKANDYVLLFSAGASIGTLRIEASDDGGNSYSTIFSKSGDQGDQWNYETVC